MSEHDRVPAETRVLGDRAVGAADVRTGAGSGVGAGASASPTAWVLCTDRRMFRFFEIELERLGLTAVERTASVPTDAVPTGAVPTVSVPAGADRTVTAPLPCLAVVDTDTYAPAALWEILPPDCPVVAYGRVAAELPRERGVYLRRPFALSAWENALRHMGFGRALPPMAAAPTQAAPPTAEATPAEPFPEVTADRITVGGQAVSLTPAEEVLFRRLYDRRGTVVSREELASLLGGGGNSVEVYICHLRSKIEKPLGKRMIRTVRGQGYMLE